MKIHIYSLGFSIERFESKKDKYILQRKSNIQGVHQNVFLAFFEAMIEIRTFPPVLAVMENVLI